MTETFQRRFWERICVYEQLLYIAVGVEVVFLLLLGFSAAVGLSNAETKLILLSTAIIVCLGLGVAIALLYSCRRHKHG